MCSPIWQHTSAKPRLLPVVMKLRALLLYRGIQRFWGTVFVEDDPVGQQWRIAVQCAEADNPAAIKEALRHLCAPAAR